MNTTATSSYDVSSRLSRVEELARAVQREMWLQRHILWEGNPPANLIDILEPSVALVAHGYKVRSVGSIGDAYVNGEKREVAGLMDRAKSSISISQRFVLPIQRFTLAHELGHVICHPGETGLHRDVPVEKSGCIRGWREVEADRFASVYLMPERLVLAQFQECFRIEAINLSEEVAYTMCGTDAESVRRQCKNVRGLSQLVATAGQFNGRHFMPLASQFRVSKTAMAIRLEELGLVSF